MTRKVVNFILTTILLTQHASYAASNSIAKDILSPNSTAYDFTFTDDANSSIYLNKIYIEVSQVVKEIEKIANALVPRDINVANCSTTGCPIDAVQCDAVTELPSCPDGSILNTTRDMCQKDPDVFNCPTGFTYDATLKQCVKPLDCPSGGTYSIERNRCEFKRIYECPAGYTQDGNVCVAPPTCPSGAIFDATLLKCTVDATYECNTGWTFNASSGMCEKNPVCIIGVYNSALDKCVTSYTKTCPSGLTLNTTTNRCESDPGCTVGTSFNGTTDTCEVNPVCAQGTYNATLDKCILSYTPTCASGYTYNSTRDRCEKTPPDCPVGTTYNATTNRCEQGAGSACTLAGGTWNGTDCTVIEGAVNSLNLTADPAKLGCKDIIKIVAVSNHTFVAGDTGDDWTQQTIDGLNNDTVYINNIPFKVTYSYHLLNDRSYNSYFYATIKNVNTGQVYTYGANYPIEKAPSSTFGTITDANEQDWYTTNSYAHQKLNYNITASSVTVQIVPQPYRATYCQVSETIVLANKVSSNVAASCPVGYTHDGAGKCYANPTCPSGGSYDGTLDVCHLTYSKSCPVGMTYDSASNACLMNPTCSVGTLNTTTDKCGTTYACPSGSILDTTANKCWIAYSKVCISGSVLDTVNDVCALAAICDGGTLNTTLDKCQMSREIVCPPGSTKDLTTGKCTYTAVCQTGATLVGEGCSEEPIPLNCPSGTDIPLDVCYSNQDACKVPTTYVNYATQDYSKLLKICVIEEEVVCASSLTWSEAYVKCEAVPICYNGMYNPENDFCYISTKECPTNAAYPCTGPIGNQWCSPYSCNPTTKQCGIAECPGGIQPSSTAEMSPSYNANLIYNAADALCINSRCDLANSSRFTYCGLEEACPSGFGVFEQNGQCFVRECPQGSFQENNTCYTLGCPKGTTEQGNGTCLVN